MLGLLADKIRVPDQYVVAMETALGHHLQFVLTEQPEAARQILDDLRANKTGRASVAALHLAAYRRRHAAAESEAAALVRGRAVGAASVIEADPSVQPLLHRLLGQTLIVARSRRRHRRLARMRRARLILSRPRARCWIGTAFSPAVI